MIQQPEEILKTYWGYDAFRPLQKDIIDSILAGDDTLALLPTGGGKSICFQVPALAMEGLCLVVSPLIALMKDQVENLEKRGIPALHIFTGMPYREIEDVMRRAVHGGYKFLYCSPERLQSNLFREYLPALPLSFVAVDEAHCISQWGYDFRPSYMQIAKLRTQKPELPFLALTASATPEVRKDIMLKLGFRQENMFSASFARENLSYHVVETDSRIHKCIDIVKKMKGSGLVYCKSRKRTMEIADLLKLEHVSADFYHAGLPQEIRSERQISWINGQTRVIVCTNAFGMGIDKPDVRFVVHPDCPDSIENYYQEAGRAGRDGEKSYAVLLKTPTTVNELEALPGIRFPTIAVIRKVYQAVCDYLGIAAGTGEEQYCDFDLNEFVKRFRLGVFEAMYAIEAMEQEGIMMLSEQVFLPSRIHFTTDRTTLEYVETEHPHLEPIIKALLRTYGGIWDQPTSFSEKQIAKMLRKDVVEVIHGIRELAVNKVVQYDPRKETPQLRLLQNRVRADDLYINPERYLTRKNAYVSRVKAISNYLDKKEECRSKIICNYFGDTTASDCGICDQCVKKNKKQIGGEQFDQLVTLIRQKIKEGNTTPLTLRSSIPEDLEEEVNELIRFLEAEGKLVLDPDGKLTLL